VGGGLIVAALAAVFLTAGSGLAPARQPASPLPYDRLSASQRRLLAGWAEPSRTDPEADIRQRYESTPERFRMAFEQVTARLEAVVLSDPENGEVLGAALDLIEAIEPQARQPAPTSSRGTELAVKLAPGARDRLRRSAEFERVGDQRSGQADFVHFGPPAVRISVDGRGASGRIVVPSP
jgi:hypothetical protein